MKDFLFEVITEDSELEGEQFFVECHNLNEAWEIVYNNFPEENVRFVTTYTVFEAEILGLDTY